MKVPGKLTLLMSLRKYLDLHKLRIMIETFSLSHFKYYPVKLISPYRNTNNKIDKEDSNDDLSIYVLNPLESVSTLPGFLAINFGIV